MLHGRLFLGMVAPIHLKNNEKNLYNYHGTGNVRIINRSAKRGTQRKLFQVSQKDGDSGHNGHEVQI